MVAACSGTGGDRGDSELAGEAYSGFPYRWVYEVESVGAATATTLEWESDPGGLAVGSNFWLDVISKPRVVASGENGEAAVVVGEPHFDEPTVVREFHSAVETPAGTFPRGIYAEFKGAEWGTRLWWVPGVGVVHVEFLGDADARIDVSLLSVQRRSLP